MRRKPLFPPPHSPTTQKRLQNKGLQATHVWTLNGRLKLVRRWWYDPAGGSIAPADSWIDVHERSYTARVREMACRLNNDCSNFDRAAQNLTHAVLVKMSGEQLRQIVLEEGRKVLAAQQAQTIPVAFQSEKCVLPGQQTTRMYAGCDGVMVPLVTAAEKQKRREKIRQKRRRCGKKRRALPPVVPGSDLPFKEFKVVTFYSEDGQHTHQTLAGIKRNRVGALARREACRLGFMRADEKIANVDGAPWIREQLEACPDLLRFDGLGLDFYHLSENVHRCRKLVFGLTHSEGELWADDLLHSFKHAGYQATWQKLVEWRASLRCPVKQKAADKLLNYVSQRQDMMEYPEFAARGWQIGSGPTEARCKTTTQRLKGRGRRWNRRNAEAVAALTTLNDSHQWNSYWDLEE